MSFYQCINAIINQQGLRLILLILLGFAANVIANPNNLTSPDGNIKILTKVSSHAVEYSVKVDGEYVINNAKANMVFATGNNRYQLNPLAKRRTVKQTIKPVIKQKSATINEHYNGMTLTLNDELDIEFRAFNDGIGYRFITRQTGEVEVKSEQVTLNFSGDYQTLFPQEQSLISHNERLYLTKSLGEINHQQFASLPLMIDSGKVKMVLTESGLRDYPGLWLQGDDGNRLNGIFAKHVLNSQLKPDSDRNEIIAQRAEYLAKSQLNQLGRHYPWRIIAVAREDSELLTNQLSYLLTDEQQITDASWIKPGKVAWDWWNANNIHGVTFKAGINTETYLYYIDFAAKYGLEYILLDEGWYHLGDVLDVVPQIDVKRIINYGKSKGVDVILWVIWHTLDQQLEKALDSYQAWGAAGIKVDFMQRDDQAMVNYYWKVAKAAAKRQLLVNFHGSYKPAGLRRAYPNVLTREGLRGLEHNKWGDYITAEHNLTLPFIRMLAGPMDYTPGATVNAQPKNFSISFNRPMSKTTRVQQMAMYMVYESPMQMLADSPSNYLATHPTTQFIAQVPTVWDETQVVSAKIADHIIIARRSGSDWFIGVMGNAQQRQFEFNLDFLDDQQYQMVYFADGINADNFAEDYRKAEQQVSQKTKVKIHLAPNGGWVARITPIQSTH